MDRACSEFERHHQRSHTRFFARERRAWEEHLSHCPACRGQRAAEEALDNLFSEVAPPGLSSRFKKNLRHRIAAEPGAQNRWSLLVMRGYWLTASLTSAVILLNMEGSYARMGFAVMMFLLLCFLGPILLLGRRLRFGLFDLILSTMDSLDKPADA